VTPLADIPLNSWCWLVGAVTLIILGTKSVVGYRRSRGELSKYMAWFSWVFLPCLLAFSVPALFTLDVDVLHKTSLIGELFFFMGLATQAAILWCLLLRRYCSIWWVTVPTALIGLACWTYDISGSRIVLSDNFINYYDPRIVSFVIAALVIVLFVPVGIYFIRAASLQNSMKTAVTSFALGLMYVGIGLSIASEEIIARQLLTPAAAIANLVIASLLLVALVLPWHLRVRLPAPIQKPEVPLKSL
jgi:hypothetical protein